MRRSIAALLSVALAGCAPGLAKVMDQGQMIPAESEAVIARAHAAGEAERARMAEERGGAYTAAMASCAPEVCAAIGRGEIALGMTEPQVLAATRTTADAWDIRGDAAGRVMGPKIGARAPSDAMGEVAFVGMQDGRVVSYTYREAQGFRTVSTPADATAQGRAAAQAEALVAQGDRYAAAGDLRRALSHYDRADVIRPGNPETTLRIAQALDKEMRPLEALMRYQLFLHQMELEKIDAHGRAAGHLAEAIALARQRIITLERYR